MLMLLQVVVVATEVTSVKPNLHVFRNFENPSSSIQGEPMLLMEAAARATCRIPYVFQPASHNGKCQEFLCQYFK